jgi:hypothetical protein
MKLTVRRRSSIDKFFIDGLVLPPLLYHCDPSTQFFDFSCMTLKIQFNFSILLIPQRLHRISRCRADRFKADRKQCNDQGTNGSIKKHKHIHRNMIGKLR